MPKQKTKSQLEQDLEQAQKRIAELEQAAAQFSARKKPAAGIKPKSAGQDRAGNEAHYRTFIEESHDGIVIFDEQGYISVWNHAQEKLTGIPQEKAIGFPYWEMQYQVLTPESRAKTGIEQLQAAMQNALKTGKHHNLEETIEVEIQSVDGSRKFVLTSSFPIKEGGSYHVGSIMHDITERKKAETALHESDQRFSRVFHSTPASQLIVSMTDGRIVDVNETFCRLSGFAREDVINHTPMELNLWINPHETQKMLMQLHAGNPPHNLEVDFRSRSGEARTLLTSFEPIVFNGVECLISTGVDITERNRVEKALLQSENHYRTLIDTLNVSLCRWKPDTTLVFTNEKYRRMFGVTDESIERKWLEFLPEDTREATAAFYREVARNPKTVTYEHPVILEDGAVRHYQWTDSPLFDADSGLVEFQSVGVDITERKQLEDQLAEKQKILESITGMIPDMVYLYNISEHRHLYINRELGNLLGYSDAEIKQIGTDSIMQEIHPEDTPNVLTHIKTMRQAEDGAIHEIEYRIKGKNGNYLWFFVRENVYQRDQKGAPEILFGICQDITEHKKAEAALHESEARWQFALEGSGDGVWDWNVQTNQVFYSHQWKSMLGYADDEISDLLSEWENRVHPDDLPVVRTNIDRHLNGQSSIYNSEHRVRCKGGEYKWILDRGKIIQFTEDKKPLRIIGTHTDITERKQAEEAIAFQASMLDQVHNGIIAVDFNNKILFWNKFAEELYQWKSEETIGKNIIDLLSAVEMKDIVERNFEKLNRDGHWKGEFNVKRKDGTMLPAQITNTYLKDINGNNIGFIGISVDITESRQAAILQETVYRIAEAAQRAGSLQDLYQKIHNNISGVMNAENFYIALYDWDNDLLNFVYSVDEKDPIRGPIPLGDGLTSQVIRTGKSLFYSSEREYSDLKIIGTPPKVWLGVPLIIQGKTIGVMAVQHYSDARAYSEREQRILEFVSSQAAAAIDLKQANDMLRASQASLEMAQSSANLGSWELDPQSGKGLSWSKEMFRLFHSNPAQGVPPLPSFMEMVCPDDRQPLLDAQQRAIETGEIMTVEYRAKPEGAEMRHFKATIRPQLDAQGRLSYMSGTVLDITEIKQAFERLSESEEKYRLLAENISDVIWIMDLTDSRFRYVSPSVTQLRGYSVEEVLAEGTSSSLTPASAQHLEQNTPERLAEFQQGIIKTYTDEIEQPCKNGSTVWTETTTRYLTNAENGHLEVYGVSRNITERKKAEDILRLIEKRNTALIEHAPDGIALVDTSGVFMFASPSAYRMFDYRAEEIVGTQSRARVHPQDVHLLSNLQSKLMAAPEQPQTIEYRFLHKNGSYCWIESTYTNMFNEASVQGIVINFRDISERKQAEEITRQQSEQIRLLYEASQQLNRTLDLNEIYQTICDFMSTLVPNDTFFISAFDQETQLITCRAYWLEDKWMDVTPFPSIPLEEEGKGTQSRVIRTGQPMLLNDYQAFLKNTTKVYNVDSETNEILENDPPEEEVTRSALIVPLKSGGMVTGVLQVASYRENAYTDNQLKLLEALALHISSAEQNAMLYTQVQNELKERKQTEDALRESNETAQAILNASTESVFLMDVSGKIIAANETAAARLGKHKNEMIGASIYAYIPAATAEFRKKKVAVAVEEAKPVIFDDERFGVWMENSIYPIIDNDGQIRRVAIYGRDITERKQGEEALRTREELYRLISTINADFVFSEYISEAGLPVTKWVGGGFEAITGYTFEEYVARGGWASILHSDDLKMDERDLAALKNNQKVISELRMIHKNGDIRWVQVHASPLWDAEHQQLTGIYGAVQDITERKKAEMALRASEEQYRVLIESLDNVIASVDGEGKFLYMNDMAADQLGGTAETLTGKSMLELFPEEVAAKQLEHVQTVFHEDRGQVYEAVSMVNGKPRWYRTSIQPIHDEDGQVARVLINSTDIHNLKTAQQELQNLNRTLEERVRQRTAEVQDLYDNSPIGYHSLDANGNIILINQTHLNWLGYTSEELIGRPITTVLTPSSAALFKEVYPSFIQKGLIRDTEFEMVRKDGSVFPILVNSTALFDEQRKYVMSRTTIFDNTDHKAADDALRNANLELARAMRMKDEFLASMSHELRTPLTGILGLSEALQINVYGPLNEKQKSTLANIETSGRHLLDLINDILDVSKIEAGKLELQLEPCSLGEICQSSIQLTKGMAAKKHQTVNFTMSPASINVSADARRLKQVLVNLLSNAVKFTPEDGQLGLEVVANEQDQTVHISIWDKGIGIAPEDLKKLFQPFVQLDSKLSRQQSGTGLGLALVQRLVELHGGSIFIQSTPGEGSRFTVSLPCLPANAAAQPAENFQKSALRHALIVEDNAADAEHLARYVRSLGIKPILHTSGKDALERAITTQPDVIFLDIDLPEVSGWEVLSQLKASKHTQHIPVIVTSVDDDKPKAAQLNADGYLVKFFSLSEMRAVLERIQKTKGLNETPGTTANKILATVMIVDDNEVNISTLADFLSTQNFKIVSVKSGVDFLTQAPQVLPDIVLMDIQMPGMDGLEATRRLRLHPDRRLASVPVIAITALAMPGDRELCIEAGADEYVTKPFRLLEIQSLIQRMVEEKKPITLLNE